MAEVFLIIFPGLLVNPQTVLLIHLLQEVAGRQVVSEHPDPHQVVEGLRLIHHRDPVPREDLPDHPHHLHQAVPEVHHLHPVVAELVEDNKELNNNYMRVILTFWKQTCMEKLH